MHDGVSGFITARGITNACSLYNGKALQLAYCPLKDLYEKSCEISGSLGDEYEDDSLLGYTAVKSRRS
jgi:hypothetical protein